MRTLSLQNTEMLCRGVLPLINLERATKGSPEWPEGWYGLVYFGRTLFVFEGPLARNPLDDCSGASFDHLSFADEPAYARFQAAASRLEITLQSLPAKAGYTLVKACLEAGYNEMVHEASIGYWLMHHLATKSSAPAKPTAPAAAEPARKSEEEKPRTFACHHALATTCMACEGLVARWEAKNRSAGTA